MRCSRFFATNRASETDEVEPIYAHVDIAFTMFYVIELLLKVVVHRVYIFVNHEWGWNLFDCVVVSISLNQLLLAGASPSFLRLMRVLKVGKVMRIFRMIRFLDQLQLLVNSLVHSIGSLFWSLVMMLLVMLLFGLVFVQAKTAHVDEAGENLLQEQKDELESRFGTVQEAMLGLLFCAIGGSDAQVYYRVLEVTGPINCLMYLACMFFMQVSVMNILTAVFVEQSMKLAQPGFQERAAAVRKEYKEQREELQKLIDEIDGDHDGSISIEEFGKSMLNDTSSAHMYLEALGLETFDAEYFFALLTSKSQSKTISRNDLIDACIEIVRGGRTALYMQGLKYQASHIQKNQHAVSNHIKKIEGMLRIRSQQGADAIQI